MGDSTMSLKRLVRVNELIKQEVAAALYRVMNERGFDLSAVSVTRVITSGDLRTARVLISIRDHVQQRAAILNQIQHHGAAIQFLLSRHVILKYTPKLTFALDESVELGDRVLKIISEMETPSDSPEQKNQGNEIGSSTPPDET
jgi:ribosome-binding factor A